MQRGPSNFHGSIREKMLVEIVDAGVPRRPLHSIDLTSVVTVGTMPTCDRMWRSFYLHEIMYLVENNPGHLVSKRST